MKVGANSFDRQWYIIEDSQPYIPVEVECQIDDATLQRFIEAQRTFFEFQRYVDNQLEIQVRKQVYREP